MTEQELLDRYTFEAMQVLARGLGAQRLQREDYDRFAREAFALAESMMTVREEVREAALLRRNQANEE